MLSGVAATLISVGVALEDAGASLLGLSGVGGGVNGSICCGGMVISAGHGEAFLRSTAGWPIGSVLGGSPFSLGPVGTRGAPPPTVDKLLAWSQFPTAAVETKHAGRLTTIESRVLGTGQRPPKSTPRDGHTRRSGNRSGDSPCRRGDGCWPSRWKTEAHGGVPRSNLLPYFSGGWLPEFQRRLVLPRFALILLDPGWRRVLIRAL